MKLSEFDYDLPRERIAQRPAPERDGSRLMVMSRSEEGSVDEPAAARTAPGAPRVEHASFRDLERFLVPGDLLVLNDTRVIRARLIGRKESGGRIELLLVEPEPETSTRMPSRVDAGDRVRAAMVAGVEGQNGRAGVRAGHGRTMGAGEDDAGSAGRGVPPRGDARADAESLSLSGSAARGGQTWLCLAGFSRAPSPGSRLDLGPGLEIRYLGAGPGEMHRVSVRAARGGDLGAAIASSGRVPLPPYIERSDEHLGGPGDDAARYQTVYADKDGAIAAPTAGLHFTRALLDRLESRGIGTARVTLHVGPATFLPVRTDDLEDHAMPAERYEVPLETVRSVSAARVRGRRIVAVGTTVVRALESASDGAGGVLPARGRTDLFIVPGFRFRVVDALLTNFHLPRSSLLALVAAFAGRERILAAYREAISAGYRFYSYGDAMLVL